MSLCGIIIFHHYSLKTNFRFFDVFFYLHNLLVLFMYFSLSLSFEVSICHHLKSSVCMSGAHLLCEWCASMFLFEVMPHLLPGLWAWLHPQTLGRHLESQCPVCKPPCTQHAHQQLEHLSPQSSFRVSP